MTRWVKTAGILAWGAAFSVATAVAPADVYNLAEIDEVMRRRFGE